MKEMPLGYKVSLVVFGLVALSYVFAFPPTVEGTLARNAICLSPIFWALIMGGLLSIAFWPKRH